MIKGTPLRYGIYLTALDPTIGREIAKTRPVVVVSLDALNRHLETVVVCPPHHQSAPRLAHPAAGHLCWQAGRDRRRSYPHPQHPAIGENRYALPARSRPPPRSPGRDVCDRLKPFPLPPFPNLRFSAFPLVLSHLLASSSPLVFPETVIALGVCGPQNQSRRMAAKIKTYFFRLFN